MNIKKTIKKSLNKLIESDDFGWIEDIGDFFIGKGLYFEPPIDNQKTLDIILDYLTSMGFTVGNHLRNGLDFKYTEDFVMGLYMTPKKRVVYTPPLFYDSEDLYDNEETYKEHIEEYAETNVTVLNGWDYINTLSGYITEETNGGDDNEWDWVKNTDPRGTIPQVGDRVVVHNMGGEKAFLRWLGGFAPDYIKGKFGRNIIGDIVEIMDDKHILLKEYYTKQKIYFPTYKYMEYLKNNKDDYKNLDMIYVTE